MQVKYLLYHKAASERERKTEIKKIADLFSKKVKNTENNMVATELIMGMGEVINYLKELEAERDNYKRKWENVKNVSAGKQRKIDELKQELHKVNDIAAERGSHNEALEEEWVRLQSQNNQLQEEKSAMKEELAQKFYKHYDDMGYNKLNIARTIGPNLGRMIEHLIKENKKLQEKTEELQEEREEVWDELEKTKEEYAELKEKNKEFQGSDKHLNKCIDSIRDQYLELKEENKKLKEEIKELKEEFIDEESSEEEKTKYDGDDWAYGYGFTIKDGEYRICISGGGEHWTDYVMNKNGCFIHNKDGMKKVFTFVSCPEGNYIKVWDTPHMEGGLTLEEGETDMYEMVKECYEEEIMQYEKEEDHIPTDSDEDSDDPDEE